MSNTNVAECLQEFSHAVTHCQEAAAATAYDKDRVSRSLQLMREAVDEMREQVLAAPAVVLSDSELAALRASTRPGCEDRFYVRIRNDALLQLLEAYSQVHKPEPGALCAVVT